MTTDLLKQKGRIFDIQRFSVHDGPGIRTIIFLKGCFLRCKWCCNPESQNYKIEEMKTHSGKTRIIGQDVTVEEVLEIIKRDIIYYRRSGGGVTLSGGEFLAQPEFAYALLRTCKENGINTAVESTAMCDWSVLSRIVPYIDYFLMDIKNIDSKKHKEFTNVDNRLILENAVRLSKTAKDLVIRVPVIPTFNDTNEEIEAIASFASKLENVKRLHLLPYHRLGYDKYIGLGRDYPMGDLKTPSKEKMLEFKRIVERHLLKCEIGG